MALEWTRVAREQWRGPGPDWSDRLLSHYQATPLSFSFDLRQFGAGRWGSTTISWGLRFRISPRQRGTEHGETYPYLLTVGATGQGSGHVYLKSIEEGKQLAEKIFADFLQAYTACLTPRST